MPIEPLSDVEMAHADVLAERMCELADIWVRVYQELAEEGQADAVGSVEFYRVVTSAIDALGNRAAVLELLWRLISIK